MAAEDWGTDHIDGELGSETAAISDVLLPPSLREQPFEVLLTEIGAARERFRRLLLAHNVDSWQCSDPAAFWGRAVVLPAHAHGSV